MVLYAATIALSAFLLFLVQPIIAKQILPWFGGSAGVWTTCMVFFQVALLAGYVYSHAITRRLSVRRQAVLHTVLLGLSLALLPIVPSERFRPQGASNPIGAILPLLAATIGLPFFLLSTTGPLVQAWFARRFSGGRVYRLYALSNLGSLLALAAYPVAIEPYLASRSQSVGWSTCYALFALLAAAAAWTAARSGEAAAAPDTARLVTPPSDRPTARQVAIWFLLAMLGSTLLLSVTNHVTRDVASIPFLWVLPLSIYLLTFMLCFDGEGWYRRSSYVGLSAVLCVAMLGGLTFSIGGGAIRPGILHVKYAVPLYAAGLFVLCMFCHGELAARRPPPRHLTRFYLMVSLGGAAGGLLVGIAAPLLLPAYLELPIALCAVAFLLWHAAPGKLRFAGAAALVACVSLFAVHVVALRAGAVEMSRNFYGTLAIRRVAYENDQDVAWRLMHGVIVHGEQSQRRELRHLPTTYFGVTSGVGRAIGALRRGSLRVGVIGTGVGTLAAYGEAGDVFRFYELDEQVLEDARSRFTYLGDSAAAIETILGDGRLSLEREAPQGYDLLVVDAFSSDSVPVHLLTRQAIQLYERHVKPSGAIAFNVTNGYLDLAPVVGRLASGIGLAAWVVADRPPPGTRLAASDWVLVTRNERLSEALRAAGGRPIQARADLDEWTDDYNNLFRVLKRGVP